jgi:hypothetical protein
MLFGWLVSGVQYGQLQRACLTAGSGAPVQRMASALVGDGCTQALGTSRAIAAMIKERMECRNRFAGHSSRDALHGAGSRLGPHLTDLAVAGDAETFEEPRAHRGRAFVAAKHRHLMRPGSDELQSIGERRASCGS